MNRVENSSGGFHVTLKRSEAAGAQQRLGIPEQAVVLRETKTYFDKATKRQFVVTTEADEFIQGRYVPRS